MKKTGFSKTFWILIIMFLFLVPIFWSVGGSRIKDEVPYYIKWVIGDTGTVIFDNIEFSVELATTDRARIKGLSERDYLAPNKGMLFVFNEPDIYPFTMKDTSISLDIIWFLDNKIVYMSSRALPGDEVINPDVEADYVLEVRPGNVSAGGWKIGDIVEINLD